MSQSAAVLLCRLIGDDPRWTSEVSADTWPTLWKMSQTADVAGLLAHRTLAAGAALPAPLRERALARFTSETRHHGFHFVEAERLTALLDARGIPSVLLKGVSLAPTVYEHPACRGFRDLDVLVPPDTVDETIAALVQDGWAIGGPPELVPAYRAQHFHLAFEAPGRPPLEVHWGVTRPDDLYHVDIGPFFADAAPVAGGARFRGPHPDDQLLHAAASLMRCGFSELKRLVDVDRMIRGGAPLRPERVIARAREGRLLPAVRLMLELAHDLFGTPVEPWLGPVPTLGTARRRLDALGVPGFPFGFPPSGWSPSRHFVRFWLLPAKARVLAQYLTRPRFERARLDALAVPVRPRVTSAAKRCVLLAWFAAWQLALAVRGHRDPFLQGLRSAAGRPSSAPPAGGTAGTPGRAT